MEANNFSRNVHNFFTKSVQNSLIITLQNHCEKLRYFVNISSLGSNFDGPFFLFIFTALMFLSSLDDVSYGNKHSFNYFYYFYYFYYFKFIFISNKYVVIKFCLQPFQVVVKPVAEQRSKKSSFSTIQRSRSSLRKF